MKNFLALFVVLICCGAFIKADKNNDPIFDQLFTLEDKWIMKTKKGAIGEQWVKMNNDYLQNRG